MTTQPQFLEQLATLLKNAGIPFMVSGSLASSFHGSPRATNDFDLIVDPDEKSLSRFMNSIPADWYASRDAAQSALQHRSMFNVLDSAAGWKVDLIIRKNRPFSIAEFSRSRPGTILQTEVPVVSVEDSILSKLEWSAASDSERQYKDALGVASLHLQTLDRDYLRRWARDLGVDQMLEKLLTEAASPNRNGI